MKIKRKDRAFVILGVCSILILILVACVLGMQERSYGLTLEQQRRQVVDLENQLSVKQAELDTTQHTVIRDLTGLDANRKAKDDEVARVFISKVTTWNGIDEYKTMRSEVVKEYNLNSTSSFLTVFLPSSPGAHIISGVEYSCRYDSMESQVYNINADVYSYFTKVSFVAAGPGGGTATVTAIFMYTVDADGNIGNLNAYGLA